MNVGKISIDFKANMKDMEEGFKRANKLISGFGQNNQGKEVGENIGKEIGKGMEEGLEEAGKVIEQFDKKDEGAKAGRDIGDSLGKGISEGIEKSKGNITKNFEDIFDGMKNISKKGMVRVTAPLTALGTAAFGVTKKAGETADRLIDLSDITGMSTDNLQKWEYVATSAGVETEAMSKAVEGLTRRIPQMADESSKASQALGRLGMDYETLSGLDVDTQMDLIIGQLADMEDGAERNSIANQLFGRSWVDLAPILGMGSEEIGKAKENAEELGAVMSGEQLDRLNEFRETWDVLKLRLQYLGMEIADKLAPILMDTLIPALELAMEKFGGFAERLGEIEPETIVSIISALAGFAVLFPTVGIIGDIGSGLLTTGKAISSVGKKAPGLVSGIKSIASGISGGLVGAIALAVASLGLFVGVLWKTEDESTIATNSIGEKFAAFGQRVLGVMKFVGAIVQSIIGLIINGIVEIIKGGLERMQDFLERVKELSDRIGFDWLSEKLVGGMDGLGKGVEGLTKFQENVKAGYMESLEDAQYQMDRPMDAYMDKQVQKGKVTIEQEIGGKRVTMLKSEVLDDKGRIKEEYKEILDKNRKAEKELGNLKIPDFSDVDIPSIAQTDLMPNLGDYDWDVPKTPEELELIKQMEKEEEKRKKEAEKRKKEREKDSKGRKKDAKNIKKENQGIEKSLEGVDKATNSTAEAIKKLGDEFKSTADSIKGYIGIFDGFRARATSSYKLLRNAEQRDKAMIEREQTLEGLRSRGLSGEVMSLLYDTGMDQLGDLMGLDRMTDEQLKKWASYQSSADASAERQALEQVVEININAKDKDYNEIEKELYRRLRLKGVTL